jgi:UDP-glucose 4-epimerase
MKFIVTGGAGFIGSHLTNFLINNGHDVIVIDDLSRGSMNNLHDIKNKIDFRQLDISNYNSIQNVTQNIHGIFHQAALGSVPQSFQEPEEYYKVIAIGTENILKLAKKLDCKLVYASSSSVYGNQTKFPISEDAEKIPLNPYGQSKLQAEKFAQKYAQDDVKVIGLRYFNVFGIGQNPNYAGVIPKFIERLLEHKPPVIEGDGTQVRNFVYIDDVVRANWMAFVSSVDHAFLNIATGITTSVNDLAEIMINLAGQKLEPEYVDSRPGDIRKSQADTSLAKKLIGWEPKISLEEGLKEIFPKNN